MFSVLKPFAEALAVLRRDPWGLGQVLLVTVLGVAVVQVFSPLWRIQRLADRVGSEVFALGILFLISLLLLGLYCVVVLAGARFLQLRNSGGQTTVDRFRWFPGGLRIASGALRMGGLITLLWLVFFLVMILFIIVPMEVLYSLGYPYLGLYWSLGAALLFFGLLGVFVAGGLRMAHTAFTVSDPKPTGLLARLRTRLRDLTGVVYRPSLVLAAWVCIGLSTAAGMVAEPYSSFVRNGINLTVAFLVTWVFLGIYLSLDRVGPDANQTRL